MPWPARSAWSPPVSNFSAEWLALREPADRRSRAASVLDALADSLRTTRPLRVLDLAAGTGSNAKYLAEHIEPVQDWLLVDHDPELLGYARLRLPFSITTRAEDLASLGHCHQLFKGRNLVTASALLDLVSAQWLSELLSLVRDARASVLFALSYDGRIACDPPEPHDELVRTLVNAHQRTDKGFGPAMGPDASATLVRGLDEVGYAAVRGQSDWRLTASDASLQSALLEGWAQAAFDIRPDQKKTIECWLSRRLEHVAEGRSQLVVGHEDVAGFCKRSV